MLSAVLISDVAVGVYHIASLKDAGKKSFGISKIQDQVLIQSLINKVMQSLANL